MAEETNNGYRHIIPLQIRFNDVDKFGHVNNTIYFQFYDTAKTDYIATVCKDVDWERLAIVVVKIEADFVSQIKGNNHIAGRTRITKIGNKSFHLEQDIIDTIWNTIKPFLFLTSGARPSPTTRDLMDFHVTINGTDDKPFVVLYFQCRTSCEFVVGMFQYYFNANHHLSHTVSHF